MNKTDLTQYADFLLQAALYRTQNMDDAKDLVQDTLLAGLAAMHEGQTIDHPKTWLVTVLQRRYYDMLRRKYRKPTVSMDVIGDMPAECTVHERLEQSEDAAQIRRCLAMLTRTYREVMIRHYMHGQSVRKIAAELGIPENTVKSRLSAGRKHMGKDFTMEHYTVQSYEPEYLAIGNSGECGMNDEPYSLVGDDRIAMNLLILAYEKPLTLPELARAIGISTVYIEPIVGRLVSGELMKRVADRVYTDFIIFTEQDKAANFSLEMALAETLYRDIWQIADTGLQKLRAQPYYQAQSPSQRLKLESHLAVRMVQRAVLRIRDEVCGGTEPFEHYPDRPKGGKWYALGNRYPDAQPVHPDTYPWLDYHIDGENSTMLHDYCGLKSIALAMFDCTLGAAFHYPAGTIPYQLTTQETMKMMYAIHTGNMEDLPLINTHCFEDIEGFIRLGFLKKTADGRVICDIPVLDMQDRWAFYRLSDQYSKAIAETFHEELLQLMQHPVKLPSHLKSVPEWLRYLFCCACFPMGVILRAREAGLFLPGVEGAVPAVFLAVEE